AFLEDHALLCGATLALYEATFDPRWVREAISLADQMLERFWDEEAGVFFDTAIDSEPLVIRPRDYFDNATPSGNSAAASSLLRLAVLLGEARYENVAVRVMEGQAELIAQMPQGFGELLCAVDFYLGPPREVAIVGDRSEARTRALLDVVQSSYRPDLVLALRNTSDPAVDETEEIPLLRGRELVDGHPAAYVCHRFTCARPVTEPEALLAELGS
ncbi:MAG: thioredoxin domain-containing protein, partial [Gemmatimonadetes bacterium]|nr:thioredoxin domain-containing protein [Gemmatimonadota bacterium]